MSRSEHKGLGGCLLRTTMSLCRTLSQKWGSGRMLHSGCLLYSALYGIWIHVMHLAHSTTCILHFSTGTSMCGRTLTEPCATIGDWVFIFSHIPCTALLLKTGAIIRENTVPRSWKAEYTRYSLLLNNHLPVHTNINDYSSMILDARHAAENRSTSAVYGLKCKRKSVAFQWYNRRRNRTRNSRATPCQSSVTHG